MTFAILTRKITVALALTILSPALPAPAREDAPDPAPSPVPPADAWAVEQMPGGRVRISEGVLEIEDAGGSTVWLREQLVAPVEISYEATVVSRGGRFDRVSDLNCFWMANDSRSPLAPYAPGLARSGKFSEYDSLLTYYVGFGGNNNSTTRFRRYDGTDARPLLPEHDLRRKEFLLEANRTYRIRLVARDGIAEFWRDGVRLFEFHDPSPLTSGWFALRTVRSHLIIRNLVIRKPDPRP